MIYGTRGFRVVAVLLLGVATALAILHQRSSELDHKHAAESHRLDQAEAQLSQIQDELQRTRALGLAVRASSAPPAAASARQPEAQLPAPTGEPSVATSPGKPERTFDDVRDALNSRFYGEAYDSSWSASARQKFQTQLSEALPEGSRLVSVECRSSMCRAEISHRDIKAHQSFVQNAFAPPRAHWDGPTMVSLEDEPGTNNVTSVAFWGREGQALTVDDPVSAL